MLQIVPRLLRRFRDDTRGSLTVEAVIITPLLLWCFAATFVFFDAFRQNSINHKAAYTIGDMLSRETDYVTPTYMDSTHELLEELTGKAREDLAVRVSVIRWNQKQNRYDLRWSQARGDAVPLQSVDVQNWTDRLPRMVDNEHVILVETWADYEPPMSMGLPHQRFATFVFTRPRFAPQLVWHS